MSVVLVSPRNIGRVLPSLRKCFRRNLGSYYVHSIQGRRPSQEDRFFSMSDDQLCLFGVFDGHTTAACSTYLSENLLPRVHASMTAISEEDNILARLQETFMQVDDEFCKNARKLDPLLEEHYAGSTATIAVLKRTNEGSFGDLWIAHTGDSRAVLVRSSGSVEALTLDHKPTIPAERDRIIAQGGFVANARVDGQLAMSRAFGNSHAKPYVTALPQVKHRKISKHDSMLCLATDGLWDVMSNLKVGEVLRKTGAKIGPALLTEIAFKSGSWDNVTVLCVPLTVGQKDAPKE